MFLKSILQTRWRIAPERVTIYPYGVFYVFTIVLAVIFAGLLFLYMHYQNTALADSLPFVLFLVFMVVVFWSFANTYVEFDNRRGRMRKMLMGFIPVTTIAFAKLQGINAVSSMAGSYSYSMFRKDARYGKGTVVSSAYTKNDDPNAVAFIDEAVSKIHSYLDQYDTPADFVTAPITSYRFFEQVGSNYIVKSRKAVALIFGLGFIALGVWLLTIEVDGVLSEIIIVAAMLLVGLIFINAAFTKITFNTAAKTITRTGLFSFFNRQYNFSQFAGLQTVRRSVNFIYSGTDINLYFEVPGKNGKQNIFTISSFRRAANIERFIQEMYQVMGV